MIRGSSDNPRYREVRSGKTKVLEANFLPDSQSVLLTFQGKSSVILDTGFKAKERIQHDSTIWANYHPNTGKLHLLTTNHILTTLESL